MSDLVELLCIDTGAGLWCGAFPEGPSTIGFRASDVKSIRPEFFKTGPWGVDPQGKQVTQIGTRVTLYEGGSYLAMEHYSEVKALIFPGVGSENT